MASNLPADVAGPLKTAKQTNLCAASSCPVTPAPLPRKRSEAAWHNALDPADVFNAGAVNKGFINKSLPCKEGWP